MTRSFLNPAAAVALVMFITWTVMTLLPPKRRRRRRCKNGKS